ncbi:biotin transporter BioY [filamentous cyanobacterium CCP5]|nr:biotin transporter BioY [filamentous cyanobacterium CCP5]
MTESFGAIALPTSSQPGAAITFLWALIGLVLTIAATWLETFVVNAPWVWGSTGMQVYSLGVTFQVGAVLLTGCVGGKTAAALAQIAYLILGLFLFPVFGFQVFAQGGGLSYVHEPAFGYLIGFIPAAWVCGYLAFQEAPKLEELALAALSGLGIIHGFGLVYLVPASLLGWLESDRSLWQLMATYSLLSLPGQLAIVCAVAVLAYVMRRLLFY